MPERSLQPYFPELKRLGVEERLGAGEVLWKEGEPGDFMVLLLDGMLDVVTEGGTGDEVVLRTVESGAVTGELSSTDGQVRSATVRARTDCRILRIPAADFRNLLKRRPDLLERLYWLQVERVRSLTRQVKRTHQRAITDPLTRLYNVGYFRERLEIELERARQTGDLVSLVLFDIDHFKRFNDSHGHEEGNVVLVSVAQMIRARGRRVDIVARYGGEEFVALLYGASRKEAVRFAETVRRTIEEHEFPGGATGSPVRMTVSAGVATFPWDAKSEEALIKCADTHLYKAKAGGRNRVVAPEGPEGA